MTPANSCCVELQEDILVVTPMRNVGELDSDLFAGDIEGILQLLAQRRARHVLIDLGRTEFFGSDAIHLFLRLHRRVCERGGRLVFCNASRNEREVLSLMSLDVVWPNFRSLDLAFDYLARPTAEILVVDDSEVDRRLIGGLLLGHDSYHVGYAESGASALTVMRESVPDLVITDLVMPEMDGLELVTQVRRLYPRVPVILLTAHGNEMIALDALERGAASYVPKSRQAEKLTETVRRVLARKRACHRAGRLHECPAKVDATFYLDNDPARIRPVVDLIQYNLAAVGLNDAMEQIRTGIALEEAIYNALYHGNLEISSQELAHARDAEGRVGVKHLLNERSRKDELRERRIVVDTHITTHTARFVIRDDGHGFDRSAVAQRVEDCFESGGNRGTMLMCALMDEVFYNEIGNQVTLIKVP